MIIHNNPKVRSVWWSEARPRSPARIICKLRQAPGDAACSATRCSELVWEVGGVERGLSVECNCRECCITHASCLAADNSVGL
jgi:hypothetical protein